MPTNLHVVLTQLSQGSGHYRDWSGSLALRACAPLLLVLALFMSMVGLTSAQTSPAQDLAQVRLHLEAASAALANGDTITAATEFGAFDNDWSVIEDGIRAQSRTSYRAIEGAMDDVWVALAADPRDAATISAAIDALWRECDKFISGDMAQEAPVIALALNQ